LLLLLLLLLLSPAATHYRCVAEALICQQWHAIYWQAFRTAALPKEVFDNLDDTPQRTGR
jgi:hypothetical protein